MDQFKRAVQKLGVVLPTGSNANDLDMIFAHYDQNGNGQIEYKELAQMLQDKAPGMASKVQQAYQEYKRQAAPQQQAAAPQAPASQIQQQQRQDKAQELQHMMNLFKDRLKMRGPRGIIGLQKTFKIMDDDGSNCLNLFEFQKACRDFKIGISEEYLPTLFNAFDLNNDKTLSIFEFLEAIRGPINHKRMDCVEAAFDTIAPQGQVHMQQLKDLYHAERHPDVMSGKRSTDQVLVEFLETFEATLKLMDR